MNKNNKGIKLIIAVGICASMGLGAAIMHLVSTSNNENEQSEAVSKPEENAQSQEDGKNSEESSVQSEAQEDTDKNKPESKSTDNAEKNTTSKSKPATDNVENNKASKSKTTADTKSKSSTGSKTFTKVKGGGDYIKTLNAINSVLDNPNLLDGSTLEMKSKVNQEYELWDGYLNEIYKVICYNLPDDVKQDLVAKENAWIKEKERKAKLAGDEFKGGTAESLAYGISAAKSTRDRCYELINTYMVTDD